MEQYHKITPNTTIVLLTFEVCIECKLLWFSCIPCLFYKQDFSRKAHSGICICIWVCYKHFKSILFVKEKMSKVDYHNQVLRDHLFRNTFPFPAGNYWNPRPTTNVWREKRIKNPCRG